MPLSSIVEAKLAAPQLRPGILPRERLVRGLRSGPGGRGGRQIVWLVAPAGYGKSTALTLWRSRESHPVAWLTVDAGDADPVRLLAHLAVSIDRAAGLDPTVFDAFSGPRISALATVVPRLTSVLHRDPRPLVIMIDDVHHLADTPSVDALAMLIDYLPPHVTIALAGRSTAGLPVARFRARGQLVELEQRDLAFDVGETAQLADLVGRSIDAAAARSLHDRTEGWPVATYLAIRRAAGNEPRTTGAGEALPAGALATFRRESDIGQYIDAELLDQTSPRVRRFLLQTSILDRMTGELCDAVVGTHGSDRILQRLAVGSQLVVPLDARGGWYRYHPLLREHLRDALNRTAGDGDVLHRRAADWYGSHGEVELAAEHLLAADDADAAAARLTGVALGAYRDGRAETLWRWIGHFDDPLLGRHPHLAIIGGWAAALQGRPGAAERVADLAETSEYGPERPPGAESYESARAALRALMARRGIAAAIEDATWAVAREPASGSWRPACLVVLGGVLAVAGDRDRADAVFQQTAEAAATVGAARSHTVAFAWRALLAIERDDWAGAADLARDGLGSVERHAHEVDASVGLALLAAARVAISRGDVGEARRLLARFQVVQAALGIATPWLSVRSLVEAGRAHLALADAAGARAALLRAEDILARRPGLGRLPADVAALREMVRGLPPGPGGASTLTPAEIRVLRLLPTYLTAPEMAQRLYVAPNTIKTQIQSIYGKLGATSRAEAVERAIKVGLLEPLPALATEPFTLS